MDVSYKLYKCLCATTLHFVNIVLSEMIISDRYLEFSVWGGLTFEGKLWWREEAVKRQRQHKVFCHVITRAFQLHLLSQGSQSFIYNPLHCMPVSAPFEVPERARVCVCVRESEQRARRGAEDRANSLGKAVECPASSRCFTHMHLKGISISGSAFTQQLRGALGVFSYWTNNTLQKEIIWLWVDAFNRLRDLYSPIKFHKVLDQIETLLHLDK